MRFGMFYELQMPKPWTEKAEYNTLWQAVEQVTYAEEMGFEHVWLVEHHFLPEFAHSSAPEVTLAVMAQHTSKMRLGFGVVLTPVHHPLHVAARAATLDIFSNGRVDVGVGRTKGPYQVTPFGTDVSQTQSMMIETLECLPGMWTQEVFSHEGENWSIPPREVIPKPLQKPHPPLWMACTQEDTFRLAGQLGLGCLVNTLGGTDKTRGLVNTYFDAIKNAQPVGHFINQQVVASTIGFCDEKGQRARETGGRGSVLVPEPEPSAVYPRMGRSRPGRGAAGVPVLRQRGRSAGRRPLSRPAATKTTNARGVAGRWRLLCGQPRRLHPGYRGV